jgi:5-methylcytosine-specific restriction endonuclease McrA
MPTTTRLNEFDTPTMKQALGRQKFRCASCGTMIKALGEAGRTDHEFGEIVHAHHMNPVKSGGLAVLDNCVILCQSCHYSAHEGGNYRFGKVVARKSDFPHFKG